jgi:uncharacterized phage protein (TIGR01671 family)
MEKQKKRIQVCRNFTRYNFDFRNWDSGYRYFFSFNWISWEVKMEWKQREILFRGQRAENDFDEDIKDWIYGYYVFQTYKSQSRHLIYRNNALGVYGAKVIPETVTQYTGLKDSKDQKIFEGDILKTEIGNLTVLWNNEHSSFCLNRTGWLFSHWFHEACEAKDCTIIGNRFQNPELLNINER